LEAPSVFANPREVTDARAASRKLAPVLGVPVQGLYERLAQDRLFVWLARQVTPEMVNRGDLRYLLGGIMLAKGDLEPAELAFRELREQLPREGWGQWGLGQTALARGERAAALGLLKEARALQPENPEGEAVVRRHFRERWMRRETVPEEDGFIEVFPDLGEMRERFRKLYGAAGSAAAP
jgi:tetratricopeptide (TPR) repeat protein